MEKAKEMQFAKRSFLLIIGSAVKIAVQLLVLYIFSRKLEVVAYGRYQSVWLYLNVLTVFGLFGLPAIILSSSKAAIKNWITSNFSKFILFAFVLNIIPLVIVLLTAANFTWPERILLCLLILTQTVSIIIETLAVKKEQESRVLAVILFYNIAFLGLHLFLINTQPFSLPQLLIGLIAINILKTIFLTNNKEAPIETIYSAEKTGKQWLYLGLNDITGVIFKWIDKWLILVFISLEQFAFYYNGSYEIPVFAVLLTAVGNIMLVEISKIEERKSTDIVALFYRSAFFLSAFIFPAFGLLFWFNKEIFLFIFSEKYAAALPVFLVSIFIIPVRITNYTAALQVYNRNDIILKGALLDLLLAIILMGIFYPLFGLPGLAAAFVLSTYIQVFYYLWHTGKLLNMPMPKLLPIRQLGLVFVFCFLTLGGFFYLLKSQSSTIMLVSGVIVSTILAAFLLYRFYKTKKV